MIVNPSKLTFFQSKIREWYLENGRKFFWRTQKLDCYKIIILEVLLKRTRAETVERYLNQFYRTFPSWKSINEVNQNRLQETLKPFGLWRQRAASLKSLAEEMIRRDCVIPSNYETLVELPAVGQYVANAVLLLCFGIPKPLLDTSMARILERFFGPRKLSDIRYDPFLQELSHLVVKTTDSSDLNWGILDYASIICTKKPKCNECILVEHCKYFEKLISST